MTGKLGQQNIPFTDTKVRTIAGAAIPSHHVTIPSAVPIVGGKSVNVIPFAGTTVGDIASGAASQLGTSLQLSALGKQIQDIEEATTPTHLLSNVKPTFTKESPIAAPINIGNIFANRNAGASTPLLSPRGYYSDLASRLALSGAMPRLNVSPETLAYANRRFSPLAV